MPKDPPPPQRLAPLLWLLTGAFVARVVGQMLVVLGGVTWLPPMSEWMSGLMPYPYLLPSQFVIIAVCVKVCLGFTRGGGWFVESRPPFRAGRSLLWVRVLRRDGRALHRANDPTAGGALVRRHDSDRFPSGAGYILDRLRAMASGASVAELDWTGGRDRSSPFKSSAGYESEARDPAFSLGAGKSNSALWS